GGFDEARAGDVHHRAPARVATLGRDLGDSRATRRALLTFAGAVAPHLLIPVLIAVDQLVVVGAVGRFAERFAEFARHFQCAALVGHLFVLAVVPGVELGVGERLAVLVGEPAADRRVGGVVVGVFFAGVAAEAVHV